MNAKSILYFTLGLASLVPFALRFFIQWILSERKKESYITPIFWYLSIIGNIAQSLHYLVQIQYHLYFIRFFPLYFSFRELSLINNKAKPFSWNRLIKVIAIISLSLTFLFVMRVWLEYKRVFWIDNLQMPWDQTQRDIPMLWHILGFFGASLFMSRVWVQWWQSEKTHESYLSPAFWWLSIIGGSLTLFYALFIRDYVTACGYITGLIPYVRNLILIQKSKKKIEA
jgi:lipid-A-disaccharide synthase-like uncharacterized protein